MRSEKMCTVNSKTTEKYFGPSESQLESGKVQQVIMVGNRRLDNGCDENFEHNGLGFANGMQQQPIFA